MHIAKTSVMEWNSISAVRGRRSAASILAGPAPLGLPRSRRRVSEITNSRRRASSIPLRSARVSSARRSALIYPAEPGAALASSRREPKNSPEHGENYTEGERAKSSLREQYYTPQLRVVVVKPNAIAQAIVPRRLLRFTVTAAARKRRSA